MNDLIKRIKERISNATDGIEYEDEAFGPIFPVTDETTLQSAEEMLGFRLPLLLRRLYLEVGNGGFGPGYGLIGIKGGATEGGNNVVDLYQNHSAPDPDDVHWQWPEKLLPAFSLGCAMYVCIDCTTEEGAVTWFEPNPHYDGEPWDYSFIPLAASIAEWLTAWLEGKELLREAFERKFGAGSWGET